MFKIICVTSRKLCKGDFLSQLQKIAAGKPDAIILREKDLDETAYTDLAREAVRICRHADVRCILHSYVKAASCLNAAGIHMPLPLLKETEPGKLSSFSNIGVSCHSPEDAVLAEKLGASYITFGHVFDTDCKKGLQPRGTEMLRETVRSVGIPVYAIGGINEENILTVKETGASGACIMSGLMTAGDPAGFIERIRNKVNNYEIQ